jgi:hypothetical protein
MAEKTDKILHKSKTIIERPSMTASRGFHELAH